MGVRVDRDRDAEIHGAAGVDVIEVEPHRIGVDLQRHAGLRGGGQDGVHVQVGALAAADQTAGRVADDVDVRIPDGRDHAPCDLFALLTEPDVHGGDDDVEPRQRLVIEVQRAIRLDLHLDPVEDGQAIADLRAHRVDLHALCADGLHVNALDDAKAVGVVRDREHFQPARDRGVGHLPHGRLAVAPGRVVVQLGEDVLHLQEFGQPTFGRRLDLSAIFAELRRDVRQAESIVDLRLGRAEDLRAVLARQRML